MKAIQSLVVWILLLALPLQGFAAASMAACSHMTAPAVHAVAPDEATHCQSEAKASAGDCSVHSDCHVAAALAPVAAEAATNHPVRSHQIAYAGAYATSCVPDRLERPPLAAAWSPDTR